MVLVMRQESGVLQLWVSESCKPGLEAAGLSTEVLDRVQPVIALLLHNEWNILNTSVRRYQLLLYQRTAQTCTVRKLGSWMFVWSCVLLWFKKA